MNSNLKILLKNTQNKYNSKKEKKKHKDENKSF